MKYLRDFETEEEKRARLLRESAFDEPVEIDEPQVAQPSQAALISDTIDENGHRVRVYEGGLKVTSIVCQWPELPRGDWVRPGNAAATAAFKAGREDEYIDRMRNRYGGDW